MKLTIEKLKPIRGEMKVHAPRRKDGTIHLRTTVVTIIEDGDLGGAVFSTPLQSVADDLSMVRSGAKDNRVTGFDATAELSGIEYTGTLWFYVGEQLGEPAIQDQPVFLRKVRAKAGSRHVKQVAVLDWLGTGEELGAVLDLHECTVRVKLSKKAGTQVALPFGEDDSPDDDEPGGEQLPLEPGETKAEKPKRGRAKADVATDVLS
jgi:hypothetical protein